MARTSGRHRSTAGHSSMRPVMMTGRLLPGRSNSSTNCSCVRSCEQRGGQGALPSELGLGEWRGVDGSSCRHGSRHLLQQIPVVRAGGERRHGDNEGQGTDHPQGPQGLMRGIGRCAAAGFCDAVENLAWQV